MNSYFNQRFWLMSVFIKCESLTGWEY